MKKKSLRNFLTPKPSMLLLILGMLVFSFSMQAQKSEIGGNPSFQKADVINAGNFDKAIKGPQNLGTAIRDANIGAEKAGCESPQVLFTTDQDDNGQSGIMFDIEAINDVVIESFDANFANTLSLIVAIYYKTGSHVGFEDDAAAWTLIGTTNVVTLVGGGIVPVPIDVNVSIPASQSASFYITSTVNTSMNYTNGTSVGSVFASDSNIKFKEGIGKGYPFGGNFIPRVFNGNINYCAGPLEPSCTPVTVTINTDNFPGETFWEITNNDGGAVVASGSGYDVSNSENIDHRVWIWLLHSIDDIFGDGICCQFG